MSHFKEVQEQYAYLDGKHTVLRHETVDTLKVPSPLSYYRAMGVYLGYEEQIDQFIKGVLDGINQINSLNITDHGIYGRNWGKNR